MAAAGTGLTINHPKIAHRTATQIGRINVEFYPKSSDALSPTGCSGRQIGAARRDATMNTLPSPVTPVPTPAMRPRALMLFAMANYRATQSCLGGPGRVPGACSTRWWRSMRRMGRPKNTSSRSWLESSGGSADCGWQRRPYIGRSSVMTRPAIRP